MSSIPRVYRSTDPGAPPPISNNPGSFLAVLDAVLVDGYGSGATAKEPLGWSRAFMGTNKRVYRNSRVTAMGNYLRVDDSNANHVRVDGYETMSSIDTGSGRFDSVPAAWGKINASLPGTGAWVIVGTDTAAYFSHMAHLTSSEGWLSFFAGDFKKLGENDQWPFVYSLTSSSSAYVYHSGLLIPQDRNFRGARSATGVPGGVELYHGNSLLAGVNRYGAGGFSYPLVTTNGMLLSAAVVREGASTLSGPPRGVMPGLWVPEHDVTALFAHGELRTDFPGLPPGTELLCLTSNRASSNSRAVCFLDITNPW